MNEFSGAEKVFNMYLTPQLCMLIHVNVGTYLTSKVKWICIITGVNEGCEVYALLVPISCRLAVINEKRNGGF